MFEEGLPISSGRLVIVPKRKNLRGPMAESCALVQAPLGKLYVCPWYVQVAHHPGTAGLRRVTVTIAPPHKSSPAHVLFAHAPYLMIGDQSFVYNHSEGAMSEAGRCLRACEASRRSGSYRTDSDDVGVCLRVGWKRATVKLCAIEGGFACECEPEEESTAA